MTMAEMQPISLPAWVIDDPDGRKVIVDLEPAAGDRWEYNGVVDATGSMITVALWPLDEAGNPIEPPPGPADPEPPPTPRSRDW
jgi:hypothetical protein